MHVGLGVPVRVGEGVALAEGVVVTVWVAVLVAVALGVDTLVIVGVAALVCVGVGVAVSSGIRVKFCPLAAQGGEGESVGECDCGIQVYPGGTVASFSVTSYVLPQGISGWPGPGRE